MTVITTKQDLAEIANAGLSKKVPFPPGKIVDVEIVPSVDARGNTAILITTDSFAGRQVPNNYPNQLRYQTQTRWINRVDISRITGATRNDGSVQFVTVPAGTTDTVDLLPWLNSVLGTTLTADDIIVAPIPAVTDLVQVTIAAVPTSMVYCGAIHVNLLPPALETPPSGNDTGAGGSGETA